MYFETIHQIILAGHWITEQVSKELKEFDVTEPQYNVLRSLKVANGEPLTVQKLQAQMVQKSSNITRIIDKLIKKNCVERKECPTNRRKMDITITENGLKLLKILDAKVMELHKPLMSNLTEKELEVLKGLILKLKGN